MMSDAAAAALFDLDGTLVDTRKANYLAYRDAFAAHGLQLTEAAFAPTWGMDSREFIRLLVPTADDALIDAIRVTKAQRYPAALRHSRPNTALISLARTLAAHIPIGLVTTAKRANVDAVLEVHRLSTMFTIVVTGDDVTKPKPDPEPYQAALTRLEIAPKDVLAFEDSHVGITSARSAGLRVIQVGMT